MKKYGITLNAEQEKRVMAMENAIAEAVAKYEKACHDGPKEGMYGYKVRDDYNRRGYHYEYATVALENKEWNECHDYTEHVLKPLANERYAITDKYYDEFLRARARFYRPGR